MNINVLHEFYSGANVHLCHSFGGLLSIHAIYHGRANVQGGGGWTLMSIHLKKCKVALWFTLRGASCLLFFPVFSSILITLVGEGELVFVLLVHLFVSYAHVNLCPFLSSFWCQGLAATSDCGTLWTFLITFFHCIYIIRSKQFVL